MAATRTAVGLRTLLHESLNLEPVLRVRLLRPGLAVDRIARLRRAIPVPPRPQQRAIADFLDRKTAAIDALIEKKERLLALHPRSAATLRSARP